MQKTTKILSLAVAMFAIVGMMGFSNQVLAVKPGNGAGGVGSGGYQLNLIGMESGNKLTNDGGNNGHRIFVPLDGPTKILLYQGPFGVLDADATDGTGKFQLPYPGDCSDIDFTQCELLYAVYIRVLGTKGSGNYHMQTCVDTDGDGISDACSTEMVDVPNATGTKGGAKFTNVSRELLTICYDLDLNGTCDIRTEIFDDENIQYLWETDANGNRLAQLRFIPTPVA